VQEITKAFIAKIINDEAVNASDIFAIIGPSISGSVMHVKEDVISQIKPAYLIPAIVIDEGFGHYKLNVKQLNYQQLIDCGLKPENISVSTYCTYCNDHLFYSHRQGDLGRMTGFIKTK